MREKNITNICRYYFKRTDLQATDFDTILDLIDYLEEEIHVPLLYRPYAFQAVMENLEENEWWAVQLIGDDYSVGLRIVESL